MTHPVTEALHQRLTQTAETLRQNSGLDDHQLAMAFLAVGSTLAEHAHGAVAAAELLRDVADEIERSGLDGGADVV